MFYIKDNISISRILEKTSLTVIYLEAVNYIGFKLNKGICENEMLPCSYKEDTLKTQGMNFFVCILKYGFNSN